LLHEQGYLIIAIDRPDCSYVDMARRLTQSLRQWHPTAQVALVTNKPVRHPEFNYVIELGSANTSNPYANDPQIFYLTPFRETIKLEADMLMAGPCDHWWDLFRHRDVVISTGCRNWLDQPSKSRAYRKLFDQNNLPDVYNAITYWRRSATAKEFFDLVADIFQNWEMYSKTVRYPEETPTTDFVYAMASQIIGVEKVTMPFTSYPKIVHMKSAHAGTQRDDWTKELVWETDPLRIQTIAQNGAFHYNVKGWQP